jgi:glycosyltransferase involved in cell wall biosynthesis
MYRLVRRLELMLLPYQTKRRAFVRKLLGKNHSGQPEHWDHSSKFEQELESFCKARRNQNCVVIISGTKYLQDEGQTPVNYAREFAAMGKNVIYIYWRWGSEPASKQDYLYDNIFLLPLDQTQCFARIFKTFNSAESILINGLPAPQTNVLQSSAKGACWKTVYLALDDWGAFQDIGVVKWYSKDYEKFVINNSGTIISINDFLASKLKELGASSVKIVPNGLKLGVEQVREKIKLERGQVTVGYFGYLEKGWFDWDLIKLLATRNPKWMIYIIGYPAILPDDLKSNVKFLGKIPQNLLASYAVNWDVGIVPFKPGAVSDGADPIKTYEYLAMGLPVVVSGVNPPVGGENLVARADNVAGFEEAIRQTLSENDGYIKNQRRNFAFSCSWNQRASSILQAVAGDRDPILANVAPSTPAKQKILFAYQYATFGGVETVLKARIESLDRFGIEAHVWFLLDMGGTSLFHQHADRCHVGGIEEFKSHIAHGYYDFVSVIDFWQLIEAANVVKSRFRKLAVEFHTPYPKNAHYLKKLKPGMIDKIIVPSEYQKKVCESIILTSIEVAVVPNPVADSFFATEATVQTSPAAPMITWVGRLDDLKNWRGFLEFAALVFERMKNVEFCIVGSGQPEDEDEFSRIMAASKVAGSVHRYRGLDHDRLVELFDYTKRSGGIVCSTSVAESFGMVIAEAMARSCTVLVPTDSAMTDFVFENKTGFHYQQGNLNDAVEKALMILSSSSLRTEIGKAAAELIKHRFHPDQVLEEFFIAFELDASADDVISDWKIRMSGGESLKSGYNYPVPFQSEPH